MRIHKESVSVRSQQHISFLFLTSNGPVNRHILIFSNLHYCFLLHPWLFTCSSTVELLPKLLGATYNCCVALLRLWIVSVHAPDLCTVPSLSSFSAEHRTSSSMSGCPDRSILCHSDDVPCCVQSLPHNQGKLARACSVPPPEEGAALRCLCDGVSDKTDRKLDIPHYQCFLVDVLPTWLWIFQKSTLGLWQCPLIA